MIKYNKASNNKLKSTKLTKLYSIAQKQRDNEYLKCRLEIFER